MKKIFAALMVIMMLMAFNCAIAEPVTPEVSGDIVTPPTSPLTWEYLATVGGCAAFVLIAVQLTKEMLDRIWKIPTGLYAYILAVITMILATAFTSGLTPSSALLTLFNGWIVSATASKTYDMMAGK